MRCFSSCFFFLKQYVLGFFVFNQSLLCLKMKENTLVAYTVSSSTADQTNPLDCRINVIWSLLFLWLRLWLVTTTSTTTSLTETQFAPGSMLNTSHTFSHLPPQQCCDGDAMIVAILQMRTLKNSFKAASRKVVESRTPSPPVWF